MVRIFCSAICWKRPALACCACGMGWFGPAEYCAWLTWSRICHAAIAPDTILIDPTTHSVRLMAGWCFSTPIWPQAANFAEPDAGSPPHFGLTGEVVDASVDLHLIRQTLREVLGIRQVAAFHPVLVPQPLADWSTCRPWAMALPIISPGSVCCGRRGSAPFYPARSGFGSYLRSRVIFNLQYANCILI